MKIAVIGKGTAGCISALTMKYYMDAEVDWYFDPAIKPQAVGEGSTLAMPKVLNDTINFSAKDFSEVDATIKTGIYKLDWGNTGKPFLHDFPAPHTAIHFNANKLQDYVHEKLKDHVNVIEKNVKAEEIDADYILDCSGRPSSYDDYDKSDYIPVNSVYVTQCYWDFPRFNYTLAIARPYGWVFGIPLQNRCSVGYMYNSSINTLEEVKEDVKHVFEKFSLEPSNDTNAFSFNNYKRKFNFDGNIAYNGNASFFLEPLEATSFGCVDNINTVAELFWFRGISKEEAETRYQSIINASEYIIMLHYFAGSSFKTDFWEFAQERGVRCIENSDPAMKYMMDNCHTPAALGCYRDVFTFPNRSHQFSALYSAWWEGSFAQNMEGLGLRSTER